MACSPTERNNNKHIRQRKLMLILPSTNTEEDCCTSKAAGYKSGRSTHLGHAYPAPPVPPPLRRVRPPLLRRRSSWGCIRGNRSGSGRKAAGITGTTALGATRRPWLVTSIVPRPVRPVLPLSARARHDPAGPERAARLQIRGLAMQVRQQALRA
ncbi:unnamed protein product, partial [Musa textilis]